MVIKKPDKTKHINHNLYTAVSHLRKVAGTEDQITRFNKFTDFGDT